MNISFIGYFHGFGGAERQLITLANKMAEKGHEVHLLIIAEDRICYDISTSIQIHSLLFAEKGNLIQKIFRRYKALKNKLRELRSDIIVNFNFQSAYLLAFGSHNGIGKVIYSERGDPGDKEYKGLMRIIRTLVLPRIDGFVFQSEGARDFFKNKHVRKNCVVIPNACFKSYELFRGPRRKVIVNVGRLSEQKNQSLLIKAFANVADKYPDYNLEIIGNGELECDLLHLIKNLKLQNRVLLKGTFNNVNDIIRDTSLFVLSSDYEGIPNALIEAMSLGLPCISTDCKPGGARTLIKNGYNGLITPRRDEISLAKAIHYMLSNYPIAQEMGRRAMEISSQLSPNKIYNRWEEFFIKVSDLC